MDLLEQEELEAGILMVNKKGEEEQASEWLGSTCCLQQVLLPGASPAGSLAKCPRGDGAWLPSATHPCQLTLVFPSVLRAVSRINAAIRQGMPAKTLEELMDPAAQLPHVYPLAAPLYQCQLALLQHQHPRVRDLPGMSSGSNRLWGGSVPLLGWRGASPVPEGAAGAGDGGIGSQCLCLPRAG